MKSPKRYRVAAVEPDARFRTRLTIQLASTEAIVADSIESLVASFDGRPTVVVFGPSLANDTGLAQAQRLGRQHPETGVVLVSEELSLSLLQQALRAGVRDALALDTDDAALRQAIDRVGESLVSTRTAPGTGPVELGRVIVTFSTKGGVGKSILATNLAVALASRSSKQVVIVDGDLQFGDVAVLLGVPPTHTTIDAAAAIAQADTGLMDNLLCTHPGTGLRVLPAPVEPSGADAISPEQMLGIVRMLRTMCGFVIVDMPPHFDDVVLALLEEADDVLLVASMDIPSIKNLKVGIQTLGLLSLAGPKLRLVLNRANAKVNLDIADVERAIGIGVQFRVPSDIAVPQAVNRGVPVVLDKPRSPAALALGELADAFLGAEAHVAEVPVEQESRRRSWRRTDKEASGQ
ncbi:MAG: pilus assembly protein CpaE [Actinomycetota bacterium]|jgi:pilus assembly protein CpaE|nr:pilus assembly protein CpaE [Actinomycetota bacterium]